MAPTDAAHSFHLSQRTEHRTTIGKSFSRREADSATMQTHSIDSTRCIRVCDDTYAQCADLGQLSLASRLPSAAIQSSLSKRQCRAGSIHPCGLDLSPCEIACIAAFNSYEIRVNRLSITTRATMTSSSLGSDDDDDDDDVPKSRF